MSAGQAENYVLLLVLLSIFAGGTLVLLSLLLLFCHRCCMGGRRYSRCAGRVGSANGDSASFLCDNCETDCEVLPPFRASDDLEKTNTTYAEDSQPTQGRSGVKIHLNIASGAQGSLPVSPSLRNHHSPGRIRRPLGRQLSRWRVRAVRLHWLYWPKSLFQ